MPPKKFFNKNQTSQKTIQKRVQDNKKLSIFASKIKKIPDRFSDSDGRLDLNKVELALYDYTKERRLP